MAFNFVLCLIMIFLYFIIHSSKRSTKVNDNLFLLCAFCILFLLVAYRATNIGNDTPSYIKIFKNCAIFKWQYLNFNTRYEIGYIIINILLGYVSSKTRFFLVTTSFIFNYSIYKFVKKNSKNYLFSVIIYINLLFFYQSMTMMRQFLALSIILLSFDFVKEKKFLKYLIMVLIASSFHTTAILGIFIYPMYNMKYSNKKVFIFSIITLIAITLLDKIFPYFAAITNRGEFYNQTIGEVKLANIILFLIYLVFLIFSLMIVQKKEKEKNHFYLYTFVFSTLFYALSINTAVLARAGQYFAVFSIISLPNIIYQNIKKRRLIFEIIISTCLIMYSSIIMIYRPEWNSAYNYKFCIQSDDCSEHK